MKTSKSAAANGLPELVARFLAVLMFCLGIAICFGRGAHAAERACFGVAASDPQQTAEFRDLG